ncbi:hypothetical protein BDN70DRAFT_662139 [Pholiota conissans]|uniref:DUF6534 domain-containing protein n=1 Tax=Pholiota conissans TaxID=109636 RepID=A0A9P6CTY0_9AGAR|nr:hypothetical protein BDN70DRAFT_662139 [Pholiota conissans]
MSTMELSLQFGPILVGVLLSMIMHGVLLSQIYSYYLIYRSTDPKLNKYMVIYILIVESIHTAFSIYMIYEPLILRFGDLNALMQYPIALTPLVSLMAAISLPIQVFVAWRIIRLQNSFWVGGLIIITGAISFAGAVLSAVQIRQSANFSERRSLQMSAILWLVPGALADVAIAATLSWSLYRRKTGLPSTDAVISRIIRLTIQTGLMTSIAALLNLFTLVALPVRAILFVVPVL